jgi:hypothetical protein
MKFFSQSDKAITRLESEGARKLEKFSKTRFGVTTWVFISLLDVWPILCKLVAKGEIVMNLEVSLLVVFRFRD